MKKPFILLLFLIFTNHFVSAQYAIINDPDGFTNVREEASSKTPIVSRIFEGEIFTYELGERWYTVYYSAYLEELAPRPRKYYKENLLSDTENEVFFDGYMHKSRILPLEEIKNITQRDVSDNHIHLHNDSIDIKITVAAFNKDNHEIKMYEESDSFVELIDGKGPLGVDGGFPSREIAEIKIRWNGQMIDFPKEAYSNFYQPNYRDIEFKQYKNYFFLTMLSNSDGAGYYDCVWIFKDGKFLKSFSSTL